MSNEPISAPIDQTPPASTTLAVPIMDTKPPLAANGEAGAALPTAATSVRAGSVVSISDSDAGSPVLHSEAAGPISPVAKMSSAGPGEDRGTKRRAESEASGAAAKKTKTVADKKEPEKEPSMDPKKGETVEELKVRANNKLRLICNQREQYKAELEDAQKQLATVEESRDDIKIELFAFEQKELARAADRKAKAAREKDWRDKTISALKAELRQDYDDKLAIKTHSIERRLGGKHAMIERNLRAKLDDKDERLEAVSEELRGLKAQSKEEIRELKNLAKVQAKSGGPRAQQALKDCHTDIKEKQKELAAAKAEIDSLKKQIRHHKAEINSEKTQKEDLGNVYTKTCTENQTLSIKTAEWRQRCALLMKDFNVSQDNHAIELRDLRAAHKHELREMDKKWEIQAANSTESQQRVVAGQRTVHLLTNANARLMGENESYQKQLQATAAEKRQKDERCRELEEKLARVGGPPLEVAKTEPSAKMQGVKGEVSEAHMVEGESIMQVSEANARQQTFGGELATAAGSSAQFDPLGGDAGWSFSPVS